MKQTLLLQVQASVQLKQSFFEREMDRLLAQADDMAERLRRGGQIGRASCRERVCLYV